MGVCFAALHLAMGQFYKDDIEVEAAQVIPLLATALLLQMEPLIDQCTAIMMETINLQVNKPCVHLGNFVHVVVCPSLEAEVNGSAIHKKT